MAVGIFQITSLTAAMFVLAPVLCLPPQKPEIAEDPNQRDVKRTPRSRSLSMLGLQRRVRPWYPGDTLPWTCPEFTSILDLGMDKFPRYVQEVRCVNTSCNHGHNHCMPTTYTINVLARNVNNTIHELVPNSLRRDWIFVNREITTGCVCGV